MLGLSLSLSLGAGGRVPALSPPTGFVFLVDDDGAYLLDDDGSYIIEEQ